MAVSDKRSAIARAIEHRRIGDIAMLALITVSATLLWQIRVKGPRTVPLDPFSNTDQYNYFYPLYRLTAQRWLEGKLPLWNPQQLGGAPLLATAQTGAFYPPNLLYCVLSTERAMQVLAFAHLWLAGVALYALCRVLGARPQAASIGALAYAWSSYVVATHLWPPCVAALAWFPVPLLGFALIQRGRGSLGCACASIGLAALILIGHFPLALHGLQAAAAYGAWIVLRPLRHGQIRESTRRILVLSVALLCGLLLSAPQWAPTLELTRFATRSPGGLTPEQIEPFGPLPWSMFRVLFAPNAHGGGYAGALVFLLLPAAYFGKQQRAEALFFTSLALIAVLIAFGSTTPFFDWYEILPGSRMFRGPLRVMCLFSLATSVGAALGAEVLWTKAGEPSSAHKQRFFPAFIALLLTLGLAWIDLNIPLWLLLATALATVAACFAPLRLQAWSFTALGGALVTSLALIPPAPESQIWRKNALKRINILQPSYTTLSSQLAGRVIVSRSPDYPLATEPRVVAMSGLRVFEDYEPLSLRRYADYASFLQGSRLYDAESTTITYAGALDPWLPILHRRLLAAAGVAALVRVHREDAGNGPTLELDRVDGALPRAYLVHGVRAAPSAESTLAAIASGTLELGAEVMLERPPPAALRQPPEPAAVGERVAIVQDEPERIVVETVLHKPGALVLLDADYPGWQATVDGEEAHIYNANYLFRAVLLPAGQHRVVFEYTPASVRLGLALFVLGFVLLGVLSWRARPSHVHHTWLRL
jgi:hypothetical protein